ncbi:PG0541 family transporter-associated protein [Gracilinema caldarium]|uniref:PG0541 family transporter-associated protein n=1 Tax=Gracilinema caldarium TaxID=215591 RepID=UPI0026F141B7|nr:PG0541 family transporter-associated protein [Gracilinema caldarium]
MIRLELFANRSVEEDLFDAFAKAGVAKEYTKIPVVHGVGSSGPRMGDAVWPEENFALIIWCDEAEGRRIAAAVEVVKEKFPHEGIKLFGL